MFIIVLKCIGVYFVMMLSLKFMGKREIAQISLFDLSIILIIANIMVIGVEEDNHPVHYYFIPIVVLSVIQKLIAYIVLKSSFLRRIIDGKESLIINDGKIDIKEMKKLNYNMDDLLVQLRLKDVYDLSNVKYCIIESNGRLSVILKDYNKNNNGICPFGLVISGKVIEENLKYSSIDRVWLFEKLKNKGISEEYIKDLIYVSKTGDDIFILEKCN